MKIKTQLFLLGMILAGGLVSLEAQGRFNYESATTKINESRGGININPNLSVSGMGWSSEGVEWADHTVGGSVGFGYSDTEGSSTTTYCIGAEFLTKLWGEDVNPNGAGYGGIYGNYHSGSSDNFDESLLRVGAKVSYFDRITALNEAQLIYGVKGFYETGSRDFSGFEDDVTGYGITAYTGVNFRLCNKASVGLEIPILSYVSRTFENGGNEVDVNSTSIALNKDNPAMAYFRWHLGNSLKWSGNKDSDGDGIWDKDDDCPSIPGEPENNGCPDSGSD